VQRGALEWRAGGNAMARRITSFEEIDTYDEATGDLNMIVETPRGSHAKFDYDATLHLFRLSDVLPGSIAFPYNYGFVPSTLAADGDALDVLVLLEVPLAVGSLLTSRPIGVIEALQHDKVGKIRNDRLIAVATHSHVHSNIHSIRELNPTIVDEIEEFFVWYNKRKGRKFTPLKRRGPAHAKTLIKRGMALFKKKT
jgi:inorganic pyrophosphatase